MLCRILIAVAPGELSGHRARPTPEASAAARKNLPDRTPAAEHLCVPFGTSFSGPPWRECSAPAPQAAPRPPGAVREPGEERSVLGVGRDCQGARVSAPHE